MKIIGGKTCNITSIFHNDSFIEYCQLAEEDRVIPVFDYKELRAQLPEEYEEDPVFDFKELSAQLLKTEKGNCRRKIVPVFKQDGQEYAQVVSMSNKDRCEAMCIDGRKKMCYLSGKMYKKVVVAGDIVLVGLRDYHDEKADVILKYELPEAKLLKAYGELPENISLNKGSLPIPASAFQYSLLGSLLLQKQLKDLCKHPVVGFSVCLMDEKDLFRWSVLVFGPPDTLYEGGFFGAIMSFPSSYPNSPPTVWFTSKMWHPNVYVGGRVCISILAREGWSPVYTVEGIVLSIISMLSSPNYESPANVDAAKEWRDNRDAFKKKVARCVRTSQEML